MKKLKNIIIIRRCKEDYPWQDVEDFPVAECPET